MCSSTHSLIRHVVDGNGKLNAPALQFLGKIPWYQLMEGQLFSRANLYPLEMRKIFCLFPESNHDSAVAWTITEPLYGLCYSGCIANFFFSDMFLVHEHKLYRPK